MTPQAYPEKSSTTLKSVPQEKKDFSTKGKIFTKGKNKHIKIIDKVLIIGTILFIASFVNYARPLIIAPIDNLETTNSSVLFEFERGNIILIDDNPEFSSPKKIHVEDNLVINLDEGKYYWKLDGIFNSGIRELTIISEVNLKLEKVDDKYLLVNAGNVILDVGVYDDENLIDNFVLDINKEQEVLGTKFVGSRNE